jgi:hypothetical protein
VGEPKQPREAWAEVGRQFEELGRALGEHFSRPDSASWKAADTPEPGPAGTSGASGSSGDRDDRRAVMDALRRVGDAAQQFGDQAGEAVRDPQLRETARNATRGLADALETTFGQLAAQLRRTGEPRVDERPDPQAWSRAADPDTPRAIVDPTPPTTAPAAAGSAGAAGPASGDSGIADAGAPTSGAVEDPEATPGPDPDPSPGDQPDPYQAPTRPPSDS